MKFLLDTHIWLWQALAPERLGPRTRALLEDPEQEFFLSPVSVWEFSVLCAKGRFRIGAQMAWAEWVQASMRRAGLREAPLGLAVAIAAHSLDWSHRDPADRLLAATALTLGLVLITGDERLLQLASVATLANG